MERKRGVPLSLIDKKTAKKEAVKKRGITSNNASQARVSSKIGAKPLNVEEIKTIEHEVKTNARFNYSNISSKADRFSPPKWLVARYKDKNLPPYTYKVDKTERSAVDFTAYRYNTDCSLVDRTKSMAKSLIENKISYSDCFSDRPSQQRTQFDVRRSDRGPRDRPQDNFLPQAGFTPQRAQLRMKKVLKSPTSKWKWSDLSDAAVYN